MKLRFAAFGLVALIGLIPLLFDCGGEEAAVPAGDGGVDGAANDATTSAEGSAQTCGGDGDLLARVPDASIADSGKSSGECIACLRDHCTTQVEACNANCDCRTVAAKALTCVLANKDHPEFCGAQFLNVPSSTQTIGAALLFCVNKNCRDACAADALDAGNLPDTDGGN